ncbi:eukaryotic translation initiation factor 2-alpha kinase 1-like isoform X2 [Homarus americanus]|uniref:eukaryotic translation initiation factor 2-alpha kinase 1-like isoform X2 n=1 Tax=Homarus americanus TaxID=6706 RepID=UPI001C47046C|nr:eukaryotic translation initiation factor 2-alpha kinase 1-like isoform X2 [Homarus americanus]
MSLHDLPVLPGLGQSISDGGAAAMPTEIFTISNQGVLNNCNIIEILIHIVCQHLQPEPKKREILFRAFCMVIKKCNAALYFPLSAFPHLQDVRTSLLREFEQLFETYSSQIPSDLASLDFSRLQVSTSPLSQLTLSNIYQHLDDRYTREFVEWEVLGRGGFGVVVKVQHMLDGCFYAIKIIPMEDDDSQTALREGKALALLNHPNIVRYYSTWAQLYVLPSHLNLIDQHSEKLRRKPRRPASIITKPRVNRIFTTSNIKIEELSSNAECDDAVEETSGEISSRGQRKSQRKLTHRAQATKAFNIIHEESTEMNYNISVDERMDNNSRETLHCNNLQQNSSKLMKNLGISSKESWNAKSSSDESIIFCDNLSSNAESKNEKILMPYKYSSSSSSENLVSASLDSEKSAVLSSVSDDQRSVMPYSSHRMEVLEHNNQRQLTIFIQMELCGESLRDWLQYRNDNYTPSANGRQSPVDRKKYLDLFKQMLLAVQCIHSANIIHRDVKPANIFFTLDGRHIKLGDFGLARLMPNLVTCGSGETDIIVEETNLTPISEHAPNTRGVGTPIYAAPELKIGGRYDTKSDMHNLGIILLEFFQPFQTGSERIHVINALKTKRQLDQEFLTLWPDIAPWILQLTDPEPNDRPSAYEVLESTLFKIPKLERSPKKLPMEKSDEIYQKNAEIAKLKEENLKQKEIIAQLQQEIENMKIEINNK